jgi:hypothetical protein
MVLGKGLGDSDPVFAHHVEGLEGIVAKNYPAAIGRVTLVGVSRRSNRSTNFVAMRAGEHVTSATTHRRPEGIRLTDSAVGEISEASRVVVVDQADAAPHETLAVAEQALGQVDKVDLMLTSPMSGGFAADLVTGLDISGVREALGRTN